MQPVTIYNNQNIGAEINSANARELHTFLNSGQDYSDWIKNRISQYDFKENQDYIVTTTYTGRRPRKEYYITLDMAKELCMVENNERGKEARRYFIECEKELTRLKAIEQTNRIANLQAIQISQAKHHQSVVSGYKSQLVKHNEQIKLLKAKLTIAEDESLGYDDDIYFKYNALLDTLNKLKFGFSELYLDIFKEDMSRRDAFIQKARVSHYA